MPLSPGLMPHRASTTSRAVAAALALALGLVPLGLAVDHVGAGSATAIQTAASVSTPSYATRWLALETGAADRVTLHSALGGQLGPTQALGVSSECVLDQGDVDPTAAVSRYLAFAGSIGTKPASDSLASFGTDSIGVKEKKSGVSCSQVDYSGSETLTLSLGSAVADAVGHPVVASAAYLDVELKQSARILATARLDGAVVGYFELQSGSTIGRAPLVAGITPFTCNNPADSGPDAGASDNCRWPISGPSWLGSDGIAFDTLSLRAENGSFSLEGGADGDVLPLAPLSTPRASIIELVDGTLDCDASTRTEPADGQAPLVTVRRLGNADSSTCSAVPYALDNGVDGAGPFAQFLKPLDAQLAAQFVITVAWTTSDLSTVAQPATTMDFEVVAGDGAPLPPVALGWCPNPTFAGGVLTGIVDPLGLVDAANAVPDLVDDALLDGVQYACLGSRDSRPVDGSPDFLQVTEQLYLLGDAKARF